MKKRRKTIDIKIFSAYNQEKNKTLGCLKGETQNAKLKTQNRETLFGLRLYPLNLTR